MSDHSRRVVGSGSGGSHHDDENREVTDEDTHVVDPTPEEEGMRIPLSTDPSQGKW